MGWCAEVGKEELTLGARDGGVTVQRDAAELIGAPLQAFKTGRPSPNLRY
jgi:hypothetical protein